MQQVLLLSCGNESIISSWDLQTVTQLSSFKNNASGKNCLCRVGEDYFAAAQVNKDAIQFWTWHKDQVLQRSFAMERIVSLAASPDGVLLAAGGASGALYVWETGSGRLLRNWPAHYKAVSCVTFSACGGILISGSEDTLVQAWLLGELLDSQLDPHSATAMRPTPLHSWSDHTLPVTSLFCSRTGCSTGATVVSSSMDRTCKIHSLGDGSLLATAVLPCAASCVTLDAGEHAMYVGGEDGNVYEVALVGEVSESDVQSAGPPGSSSTAGGRSGAVKGNQMEGISVGHAVLRPHAKMSSHSQAVTCISVTVDGEQLVSGSQDGTAQVWDLRSRQAVRSITAPSKQAITSLLVIPKPTHLTAGGGGGSSSGSRSGPKRLAPLAPLVKYAGMSGSLKPWESTPVVLGGGTCVEPDSELQGVASPVPYCSEETWTSSSNVEGNRQEEWMMQGLSVSGSQQDVVVGESASQKQQQKTAQEEVARLKAELEASRKETQSWKQLHAQLHDFCVQNVVNGTSS